MFESILHIHTVKSFNLQNRLVNTFDSLLFRYSTYNYIVLFFKTCVYRELRSTAISIGSVFCLSEVVQIIMFAIMLRFGAFIVALPSEHKLHANFLNILV